MKDFNEIIKEEKEADCGGGERIGFVWMQTKPKTELERYAEKLRENKNAAYNRGKERKREKKVSIHSTVY